MEKGERWGKIKELFAAALEREADQRNAFLEEACGQDHELQHEVASLLSAHEKPNDLSDHPWRQRLLDDAQSAQLIGPYRLIKRIGEGGMGQVWLAEQTEPVRRQVALKLIRAGMYSESLLQRFQYERQSLAMMDHPSIAKVFEAGSTPSGQPYLVMEYVPGLPITEYCDQRKLKIRDRLELFMKVCEAVQHAHQKAILHRDLKPANILVVEVDGKPVPRIIDFGLAKAAVLEAGEDKSLLTQQGVFLGTPGYMSPEQADPDVQDIDTRTDVYSLGVVLYVLLTGFLPFDTKKKPVHEVLRQLREEEPPRPSTKVGLEKESSTSSAAMRGAEPRQLVSLLEGDLDWIAMKALEKDRNRRYGTPSDLAADIGRHLKNEPIVARPASGGYRLQKYLRRHRIGVTVAAGLVLLLAGFATLQAIQLRRITRERDRADRVTEFMSGMFKVSDPSEARGSSVTAREILDKASKDIDTGLARDPELQTQMMEVMGRVYGNLGLYPRAESLLRRSADTRRVILGAGDPQTLSAVDGLALTLNLEGHFADAEKLQRETLETQRRVLGPEHPDTVRSMEHLAETLRNEGHFADAETLQRQTLETRRRVLGPEHPDTLFLLSRLALTVSEEGRYAEAEKMQREALGLQRRLLGPEHPATLVSMHLLAGYLRLEGRYAEAEELLREALDVLRRIYGPEHPDTLVEMQNLAWTLNREGRHAEAEKLQRETLDIQRRVLGPEHRTTLKSMNGLANTLNSERRYAEAEELYKQTLEIQRRVLGAEHPDTLRTLSNLGATLVSEHHYADAQKLFEEVLEIQRRVLGPEHPDTAFSMYNVACMEARTRRSDDALMHLREAVDHGLPVHFSLGIEKDSDFKSLHSDPRFAALVAYVKERVAAAQNSK